MLDVPRRPWRGREPPSIGDAVERERLLARIDVAMTGPEVRLRARIAPHPAHVAFGLALPALATAPWIDHAMSGSRALAPMVLGPILVLIVRYLHPLRSVTDRRMRERLQLLADAIVAAVPRDEDAPEGESS